MNTFKLVINTPEKTAYSSDVDSILVPSSDGYLGVMANHAPMISTVAAGILKITKDSTDKYLVVGDGVMNTAKNSVKILTDTAIESSGKDAADEKLKAYKESMTIPRVEPSAKARLEHPEKK